MHFRIGVKSNSSSPGALPGSPYFQQGKRIPNHPVRVGEGGLWIYAIRTIGAQERTNGLSSVGQVYAHLQYFVCYETCHSFVFYLLPPQKVDLFEEMIQETSEVPNIQLFTTKMVHNIVNCKRFVNTSWLPK